MDYRELEKAVFDHLYTKHQTNSTFTFSVRKLPSKGATLDYFIGTEKSNYLGFTLWDIPVGFPGSSGDLVDFICAFKKGEWQVYFQYHHTRKPEGEQNIISLQLGKILREIFQNYQMRNFIVTRILLQTKWSILKCTHMQNIRVLRIY
ncbi:MAG: hypothetical protein IPJ06_00560 [Saprospiraceae bacterium]|nr:hypothetical protein [Saprospiraceae bacterium]